MRFENEEITLGNIEQKAFIAEGLAKTAQHIMSSGDSFNVSCIVDAAAEYSAFVSRALDQYLTQHKELKPLVLCLTASERIRTGEGFVGAHEDFDIDTGSVQYIAEHSDNQKSLMIRNGYLMGLITGMQIEKEREGVY